MLPRVWATSLGHSPNLTAQWRSVLLCRMWDKIPGLGWVWYCLGYWFCLADRHTKKESFFHISWHSVDRKTLNKHGGRLNSSTENLVLCWCLRAGGRLMLSQTLCWQLLSVTARAPESAKTGSIPAHFSAAPASCTPGAQLSALQQPEHGLGLTLLSSHSASAAMGASSSLGRCLCQSLRAARTSRSSSRCWMVTSSSSTPHCNWFHCLLTPLCATGKYII